MFGGCGKVKRLQRRTEVPQEEKEVAVTPT